MQIQPRQEILAIWEGIARISVRDGRWRWGGRGGRNSISDAEQLLCLLGPAMEIPVLALDDPDRMADDVVEALSRIGDRGQIPQVLMRALLEFLNTYTAPDGAPIFAGGSRFAGADDGVTAEQRGYEVVDSFAISVPLMLAVLGFARTFRRTLTREDLRRQVDDLAARAGRRLTAAMVGLLRSFAVNRFPPGSVFGERQIRRVSQDGRRREAVIEALRTELQRIHARFRDDITIGSGAAESSALYQSDDLFECGWSWSVVRQAPRIGEAQGISDVNGQRDGLAENAPYLYFTAVALEAIEVLLSERTQLLNLLDPTQLRLAHALQLRYQLTHAFWAGVATFGTGGRWPLEDLPWQTTDGLEYEYYSLLVSGMFVQERVRRPAADADLSRVGEIFAELAERCRITRRAVPSDEAVVAAHVPGDREPLRGSESGGPELSWTVADIAPLLLARTLRLASHFDAGDARSRVLGLADQIWQHLRRRKIETASIRGLWDQPGPAFPRFPGIAAQTEVSWYHTRRVVDCLVGAGRVVGEPPRPSPHLATTADEMINEADRLLHIEFFRGPGGRRSQLRNELDAIASLVDRGRTVAAQTPGVTVVLAGEALRRLHQLAQARVAGRGVD